ncbi:hypothetical protein CISG_08511 [Coccidioides immitis RMSCC 3703]|uniref:Uncharacterized protein n=1 Tax=Coccidioides immitis RMSCC 3703 TaxID=454286 RepID=A0A0J8R9X1_COCIT|nr:hypothetical protein CISG_08511 [Coccidioides immitis RMSCC 3703]
MMLSAVPPSHLITIDPLSKPPPSLPSTPTPLDHHPSKPCTTFQSSQSFEISSNSFASQPISVELEMSDLQHTPLQFEDLPIEIHEAVLDHLFGVRGAALASVTPASSTASSWSKTLRHPRRKALSDLALVSRSWRPLVQERIYRHIQVKGTTDGLQESAEWFSSHPHLGPYVRHIEIWVPVWGDRLPRPHALQSGRREINAGESLAPADSIALLQSVTDGIEHGRTNHNFRFANRNATLQQIFYHVACFFPDAKMLTLEGGHCKKPPMIKHFCSDSTYEQRLEVLPNIQTFIMRGAWNIMREYDHWCNINLIIAAAKSLDSLTAIQFMRIRYIDLDSIWGLLNPYYQLVGNTCTGLWSEEILETLHATRPMIQFEVLDDGILPEYGINSHTGTGAFPRSRPRSMKASAYEFIADKSKS